MDLATGALGHGKDPQPTQLPALRGGAPDDLLYLPPVADSLQGPRDRIAREALEQGIPVLVQFAGVDGAGKGSTVNMLHAWMDTRLMTTNAYGLSAETDDNLPRYWRYWRDLPRKGRISFNPIFSSDVAAQASATGAAPSGRGFATIYIPPRPKES